MAGSSSSIIHIWLLVFLTLCLELRFVSCDAFCAYYPNYPNITYSIGTGCYYGCCGGSYPTTADNACCGAPSYAFLIVVIVGAPILAFILVVSCYIVGKVICIKYQRSQHSDLYSNYSDTRSMDRQAWSATNPYGEIPNNGRSNSNPVVAYPDVYMPTSTLDRQQLDAQTNNASAQPDLWQQPPPPKYNEIILKPENPQKPSSQGSSESTTSNSNQRDVQPVGELVALPTYESLGK